jgi:hypothetical protein
LRTRFIPLFDYLQATGSKESFYYWTSRNPSCQYVSNMRKETEYAMNAPASHRGRSGSSLGLVMWDFVMDKIGAGAGFFRELRFPLPIYIPSASPQSSSLSPEAGTIGQEWPQCQ